jgi:hypothetical protein
VAIIVDSPITQPYHFHSHSSVGRFYFLSFIKECRAKCDCHHLWKLYRYICFRHLHFQSRMWCGCASAAALWLWPHYHFFFWGGIGYFFVQRFLVNTSRTNRFFKFFLDFDDAIAWPNDSDFQAIAYFNVQQLLSLVIFPHDRSIFFLALTGAQLYNTIHPATVPGCRFLTQMRCWTKRLVCSFLVRFIH